VEQSVVVMVELVVTTVLHIMVQVEALEDILEMVEMEQQTMLRAALEREEQQVAAAVAVQRRVTVVAA
jgi:hypothetical protein